MRWVCTSSFEICLFLNILRATDTSFHDFRLHRLRSKSWLSCKTRFLQYNYLASVITPALAISWYFKSVRSHRVISQILRSERRHWSWLVLPVTRRHSCVRLVEDSRISSQAFQFKVIHYKSSGRFWFLTRRCSLVVCHFFMKCSNIVHFGLLFCEAYAACIFSPSASGSDTTI